MQNIKLKAHAGDSFSEVSKKAKEVAQRGATVQFDFNGVLCLVNSETVLSWLERDYNDSFIMEWKTIGPDCPWEQPIDIQIEILERKLVRKKNEKIRRDEQHREDEAKKNEVDKLTHGVTLLIWPDKQDDYKKFVENNSKDGYSRAVVDYAEQWAKLMQIEISKGNSVIPKIAESTQKPLEYLGITGFQYGCVMQTLSTFWQFGEELRRWHNKEYGVSEDKPGVVNPAVLTVNI